MTDLPDAVGVAPPDSPAEADDEVEPVELLVQLAEEDEIDPWDIDIVDATDAFLDRLDATDLRTSGRALFYASVLLRMKSDALVAPPEPEESEPEPWEARLEGGDAPADAPGGDPVAALDAELDRRLDRKHARGSPETLDELVRELREAERGSWWKNHRTYDTDDGDVGGPQTLDYRAAGDLRRDDEPTADDVTGTTHGEDIEASVAELREALVEHYDAGRDEVLFAEVRGVAGPPIHTYLALLFLSHRGVVRLAQDDLFGDLWIEDADATGGESGAPDGGDADPGSVADGRTALDGSDDPPA
jgi:segregation and condensation protein A